MLDTMKLSMQGAVKIYAKEQSKEELIFDGPNAILPTAHRVVAHNVANQPNTYIDTMEIWDGLVLKATISNVVATVDAPPGGPYKSVFVGLFNAPSFYGDFDKVILKSSGVDSFSELNLAPALTKGVSQQISIQWKITFI